MYPLYYKGNNQQGDKIMENLILKPRRTFSDGSIEDIAYTPMGALSGEEVENISIEEHQILKYHENYRKALNVEASWWEVYSTEEEIDAEIALQERAKSAQKVVLKMELDSDFKNGIVLRPKPDCAFKCARAGFAAKVTNIKVTIKYE